MKIKLFGRKINEYGDSIFDEDGVIDLLLSNFPDAVYADVDNQAKIENKKFLKYIEPTENVEKYHQDRSNDVFIPDEYKTINVREYVLNKCSSSKEIDRINVECDIIDNRNMNNFFRCMIYLVDVMRQHNIVWGVGRGSSVASYVLYKIGIHKIDSIKYEIDYNEFFKE